MNLALVNLKGGTGKSTLCLNLAGELTARGARVLVIDADPQGTCLDFAAARESPPAFTVVALPRPTIHRELKQIGTGFDHVLVDCPPRVGDVIKSALLAVDLALVPVSPSPADAWATREIVPIIEEAAVFNAALRAAFIVNRAQPRTALAAGIEEALQAFPFPVLRSRVSARVVFAEAIASGRTARELGRFSAAAREIESLTTEVLNYGSEKG